MLMAPVLIRPRLRLAVPTMFLKKSEQLLVQRSGITEGQVGADMIKLPHPYDSRTHHGIRKDEAEHHLRQAHGVGKDGFERLYAFHRSPQVFRIEVSGPPVALGKSSPKR